MSTTPDQETPAPATPAKAARAKAAPTPVLPPPSRPANRPVPQQAPPGDEEDTAEAKPPTGRVPARAQVAVPAAPDEALTSMFTSPTRRAGGTTRDSGPQRESSPYAAFMGIVRDVDPEQDLAPSAARLPKYVIAAITLLSAATGRAKQQIMADALTGKEPIPAAVLDAAYMELYSVERPDR